jgi:hypothetical protein
MKKLVWLFGILLALSFVLPHVANVTTQPTVPAVPALSDVKKDAKIVEILAPATAADKARVVSIYTGLRNVLARDKGNLVNNTEKFYFLHGNTLTNAVEQVNKYNGLDLAIEAVFFNAVKTKDVIPVTAEISTALCNACDIIINSAK